jgi:hypothetical protein
VLAVAAIAMPPAPIGTMSSSDNGNQVDDASATEPTPSRMAPAAIRIGRGLPATTSATAAVNAPTPDAVMRKP